MSEAPPIESQEQRTKRLKVEWQRRNRKAFKEAKGYSTSANDGCGGLREAVLERDGRRCVKCGMTDDEHKEKWGRPITIDHKDKNREHNVMENLQTLCLTCHGRKDLIADLKVSKVEPQKEKILAMRAAGSSCNAIAKEIGVGCKIVTKWLRRWQEGVL